MSSSAASKRDPRPVTSTPPTSWVTPTLILGTLIANLAPLINGFTPEWQAYLSPSSFISRKPWVPSELPSQAQRISPKSFAVLPHVPPPSEANGFTLFTPPGITVESLKQKPFLVLDDGFWEIIGENPTLTMIATGGTNPLFHEAPVWYPPTDEMFFAQSAGPPAAGTGLHKSSIIQKISLTEAETLSLTGNGTGWVEVVTVNAYPPIINPNGGANFRGEMIFMAEGMGEHTPPSLCFMNPLPPYNTTVLLNNYFGRQFNSVNDLAIHPKNGKVYFTDVNYGYLQHFRPESVLPNQVYKFDVDTGAVVVVADGFSKWSGITFSPDGRYCYIADTGMLAGAYPHDFMAPSSIYRYTVNLDGTLSDRITFAYINVGAPDGIHTDTKGNVYAGCGDGVHVWSPSGTLLGIIYIGQTSANFQFAGKGRMVILGETELFYVTLAAEGMRITDL
ncbi:hypothetical protein M231_01778 [Tremella mesenterica]|uniref:SMP-30/Gluconolactonase/LRE-like region domain-containing protein n=1 Tax=Tremella mesenterica TaxID=5217 RepID=A0A4Q1BSJ2_TREME|nr:hypothetical protein M231_01778 [Tremella mesenterica]